MKYNEVQVCVWRGGQCGDLGTALRQATERQFHCHFFRLSQTKAAADSWFSGGEERREKPTDKHRLHSYMQMLFFLPFAFPFFFLCTLLEGASRALNMQLLCHYCQPGCLSANRRLNALPPPPPFASPILLLLLPLQVIIQSATRRPSNRKLTVTPGYVGSVSLQSPPRSGPAYLSVSHTFRRGGIEFSA